MSIVLTTTHGRGTTAAKPAAAAANAGYIYFDTTLDKLQRSNGSAWEDIERADPAATAFAGVKVYKAASQSVNDSTFVTLAWDAEDFDTDGFHSTASNTDRLTVPSGKNGYYVPFINLSFGGDLDGYRDIQICKNGTAIIVGRHRQIGHTSDNNIALTFQPVSLVATDYLIARFFHTAGAALTVYGDNDFADEVYAPRFGMYKVG